VTRWIVACPSLVKAKRSAALDKESRLKSFPKVFSPLADHHSERANLPSRGQKMDFDHAIAAHSEWKQKLSNYLRKPDRSLDPSVVASDNRCDLGKWLVSEGKKFAGHAEYKTLVSDHARFHKAAGDIVRRANAGENVSEETALGNKSEFASASTAVVRSLMALKSKVGALVSV
jgi:hypothetical protein